MTSFSLPTNIVVPFKDPSSAKQRLSEFLTAEQRHALAVTLFDNTLATLTTLPSEPHVLVVTDSESIASRARSLGASTLLELKGRGETAAVVAATAWSIQHRFPRQAVIPADMARLDRAEVEELLATRVSPPGVVLCPAVGDDGTNAIMTTPPDAVPFRFGQASFPEYLIRAAERGVTARVLRLSSFVLDLDTPEDLKAFLAMKPDTPAHALLREWGVAEQVAAE
jgi:2-phospho-L-lactate guanylyltransferase